MAKDPAFLFYPGDWLGGTMGMTFEEKGAYIELLMFQFNNEKFTEAHAKRMLGTCFTNVWQNIQNKFKTDGTHYWNERLKSEKEKRANFCESRRQSALGSPKKEIITNKKEAHAKHTQQRMEDEDENEIKDVTINKDVKEVYNGTDISFINFYNTYDKKKGYKKCLLKWENGGLSKEKKKLAIDYLSGYKKAEPDKFFRQNPLTYLNGETWNDELITAKITEANTKSIKEQPTKIPWKYDKK